MSERKLKGPLEYLKEVVNHYTKKENFLYYSKSLAPLIIIYALSGYLISYFYNPDYFNSWDTANLPRLISFILFILLSILLNLWINTMGYMLILHRPTQGVKKTLTLSFSKIWKFFSTTFLVGLIVSLGFILLIIPGVIFGVWYAFTLLLVLDKNLKVRLALKKSKEIVKGRFWKVFGRLLVIGLITGFTSAIVKDIPYGVGEILNGLLTPLYILPIFFVYKDLIID